MAYIGRADVDLKANVSRGYVPPNEEAQGVVEEYKQLWERLAADEPDCDAVRQRVDGMCAEIEGVWELARDAVLAFHVGGKPTGTSLHLSPRHS